MSAAAPQPVPDRPAAAADRQPVFQAVLGPQWQALGEVIRRHYFLRPYSDDRITVSGVMHEVHHNWLARLMMPFARIAGALVPYRGRDVPIDVHYDCRPDDGNIYWNRVFRFDGRPPFHFRSHMEQTGPGQVIEFVRLGIGLRLRVSAEDGALVFRDAGYVWRLFGLDVPLPVGLLLGRAYVEERPVDAERFSMKMHLRHPLFGEVFRYSGSFSVPADTPPATVVADSAASGAGASNRPA